MNIGLTSFINIWRLKCPTQLVNTSISIIKMSEHKVTSSDYLSDTGCTEKVFGKFCLGLFQFQLFRLSGIKDDSAVHKCGSVPELLRKNQSCGQK